MAASTSQVFQSLHFRKRSNPNGSDDEGPNLKATKDSSTCFQGYYYVLESESDLPTDEDTESIYSLQGKPTDSAKDTSDLSYSDDSNIVYTIGGNNPVFTEEYEPAPLSEFENPVPDVLSSASDGENIRTTCEVTLFIHDEDTWADDSSSSTSESELTVDPEISLRDYWSCVQCKATNNNPLFRYCEKCFKIRKNFFPPRPKQKKKKKQRKRSSRIKDNKKNVDSVEVNKNYSTPVNIKGESFDKNFRTLSSFSTLSQNSSNCESKTPENLSNNLRDSNYYSQSGSTIILNSQSSELSFSSNNQNLSSFNTRDSLSSLGDSSDKASNCKDSSNLTNNGCIISEISSKPNEITSLNSSRDSSLCQTCLTRPKDGLFVHGRKLGHMFCCYECSKKVWKKTGRCPLCNCKVNQVLKVIS